MNDHAYEVFQNNNDSEGVKEDPITFGFTEQEQEVFDTPEFIYLTEYEYPFMRVALIMEYLMTADDRKT